jgi:hypothetical protein
MTMSKMEHLTEFLKAEGAVKDVKDVGVWLSKNCQERELFAKCVANGLMTHVSDWKKFMKGLTELKKTPYMKDEHGEKLEDYFLVRQRVWGQLGKDEKDNAEKLAGGAEGLEARRYSFATWAIWQHPYNKNKMYLPISNVVNLCTKWKLDLEELFKHIRKHPTGAKGVYLSCDLSDAEQNIGKFLNTAKVLGYKVNPSDALDATQNKVIQNMLSSPFSAIQGGAGCGKTFTLAQLIKGLLEFDEPPMIFCLAFTHKAKRCIADKLRGYGIDGGEFLRVSTIHSFIATYKTGENMIPRCVLLIDESSMVDLELLGELAFVIMMRNGAGFQLGFVGDMMQLPPIGRGEFFRQLVGSGLASINQMKVCYRAEKPDLFDAYQAVREGRMPTSSDNFTLTLVDSEKAINSVVGRMIKTMDMENVQFIAWQNKDVFKLNKWIQEALLAKGKVGPECSKGFYKGDRVIYKGENTQTLTNAMTGIVVSAHPKKGVVVKWCDGKEVNMGGEPKDIMLSFCFTGHASQGDEYDTVVIACYDIEKMIKCLDRRWFYVGLTRGKKKVYVVATKNLADFIAAPIKSAPLTGVVIPGTSSDTE